MRGLRQAFATTIFLPSRHFSYLPLLPFIHFLALNFFHFLTILVSFSFLKMQQGIWESTLIFPKALLKLNFVQYSGKI